MRRHRRNRRSWGTLALTPPLLLLASSTSRAGGGLFEVVEEADTGAFDSVADDFFARSVAIDGDTLVVGASNDHVGGVADAGSATIFERSGGSWSQVAQVFNGSPFANAFFGQSVDVDGDLVVVGEPGFFGDFGRIYGFRRNGAAWPTENMLFGTNTSSGLGTSVDVVGNRIVAGLPQGNALDPTAGVGPGSVVVVDVDPALGWWTIDQYVTSSDGVEGDTFGFDVALSEHGPWLAVGAPRHDVNGVVDAGAVYVYRLVGSGWAEMGKLVAADPGANDYFGWSIAMRNKVLVVGAPFDDDHGSNAGTATVFRRDTVIWTREATLAGSDTNQADYFGIDVDVSGERLLIGAYQAPGHGATTGAGYVFQRQELGWFEQTKLLGDDPSGMVTLGISAALQGDTAVLGDDRDEDSGPRTGAVHVFRLADRTARFCDGSDGSLGTCPCGGGVQDTGCENAASTGGVRLEVDCLDPTAGTAVLLGTGFPPGATPAAVLMRTAASAAPSVFFDGVLCLDLATFVRLAPDTAWNGVSAHPIAHGAGPGRFFYQLWYRNNPATWCDPTAAASTSAGRSIDW